jgi:hypothetical protein
MPNSFAFVSLLTSDAYLPGTLALAAAIRDVHAAPSNPDDASPFDLVCLVTPQTVDVKSIKLLRRAYTHVVGVEVIEHHETENLRLLGASRVISSFLQHLPPAEVSLPLQSSDHLCACAMACLALRAILSHSYFMTLLLTSFPRSP